MSIQKQKKSTRVLSLTLAALMVFGVFAVAFTEPAQARNLADIDREISETRGQMSDLENRTAALAAQRAEVSERMNTLRAQEGVYLEELSVLEEELRLLQEQITLTEEQIALYQQMIEAKELRLEDAIEREETQLQLYQRRVRAMEERGSMSYIQMFLRAQSFSDLIAMIHDAEEIVAFDQRVADQLERYRIAVQEYRDELEAERAELEILIAQLEAEQAELEVLQAEIERRIREVEALIEAQEIAMAELDAEYERFSAELLQRAQALSELDAARQQVTISDGSRGNGQFIWPVPFTRNVTSRFGWRTDPLTGQQRHHNGIDIAAANIHGQSVLAAAGGVVVGAGWNGGFGNWIQINHENGYVTVYAHLDRIHVSRNQRVNQGYVIGTVGNTGRSTGPHLHFEIIRNGRHVNPMIYF